MSNRSKTKKVLLLPAVTAAVRAIDLLWAKL